MGIDVREVTKYPPARASQLGSIVVGTRVFCQPPVRACLPRNNRSPAAGLGSSRASSYLRFVGQARSPLGASSGRIRQMSSGSALGGDGAVRNVQQRLSQICLSMFIDYGRDLDLLPMGG